MIGEVGSEASTDVREIQKAVKPFTVSTQRKNGGIY